MALSVLAPPPPLYTKRQTTPNKSEIWPNSKLSRATQKSGQKQLKYSVHLAYWCIPAQKWPGMSPGCLVVYICIGKDASLFNRLTFNTQTATNNLAKRCVFGKCWHISHDYPMWRCAFSLHNENAESHFLSNMPKRACVRVTPHQKLFWNHTIKLHNPESTVHYR